MAEKKRGKRKKSPRRERKERRFLPEQTHTSRTAALVGVGGSLALGAGVYAQWLRDEPMQHAAILVAAGAAALGAGLWMGTSGMFPVRVGDAGIAVERGDEIDRVAWCDIEKLRIERGELVVSAAAQTLRIPVGAQPKAAALIITQASERVPNAVDVGDAERRALPEPRETAGVQVEVVGVQVAGRRCAASDTLISFERDARLCPKCAQVYHRTHVPKRCVTCDDDIHGRAFGV